MFLNIEIFSKILYNIYNYFSKISKNNGMFGI
jgi:hypothetical protein